MKIDLLEEKRNLLSFLKEEAGRRDEPQQRVMTDEYGLIYTEQDVAPDLNSELYIADINSDKFHLDGYGFRDPDSDVDSSFQLIITDMDCDENNVGAFNASDVDRYVAKAIRAIQTITNKEFLITQEEQWPTHILGTHILDILEMIPSFRVVIFTTRELRIRSETFKVNELLGRPVKTSVVDIKYWAEYQNKGQISLEIDLIESFGVALPCLKASNKSADIDCYLLAIKGDYLADIYATYGDRLLESNIRTFLAVKRDSVNEGMQATLHRHPDQFFAFNNGITATAEKVVTRVDEINHQLEITNISNLQIVNGGQTTASLKYARDKNNLDLSEVYVQIKLNVLKNNEVKPEDWHRKNDENHDTIRKIARYSNTQNKVAASDLESNHQVLVALERHVKDLKTPKRGNNTYSEDWFYERSRGRYNNLFAYKTTTEKNKLKARYPKHQYLEKTTAARYFVAFEPCRYKKQSRGPWKIDDENGLVGATHASIGAQRAFDVFMGIAKGIYLDDPGSINRLWATDFVSKAITYMSLDVAIQKEVWYKNNKGFKAQTINYVFGIFAAKLHSRGLRFDTRKIWAGQVVPERLMQELILLAEKVATVIRKAHPRETNPTQFAKRELAWEAMQGLITSSSDIFLEYGISRVDWQTRLQEASENSIGHDDAKLWEKLYKKYYRRLRELHDELSKREKQLQFKALFIRLNKRGGPEYDIGDGTLLKNALIGVNWEEAD
jgi:hypothetical protein